MHKLYIYHFSEPKIRKMGILLLFNIKNRQNVWWYEINGVTLHAFIRNIVGGLYA